MYLILDNIVPNAKEGVIDISIKFSQDTLAFRIRMTSDIDLCLKRSSSKLLDHVGIGALL